MLGETLVELGYLSGEQLQDALAIEERNRTLPLGQILADMGVVEPEVIHAVMARKLVTGGKTDVQFDDLGATYAFGLAAFDNAQVRHAFQTGALKLQFGK